MNKKILLPVSLVLLVGLLVFVSAELIDQDRIEVSVNMVSGWNLVSNGIWAINPASDSEIKIEDISVIYFYDSSEKKYKQIFPRGALTNAEEEEVEDLIMKNDAPATWIYSKKSGNLKFATDDVMPLNQRPLYSGYNFVSITPIMDGQSLNNLKGTCNIEKAYLWDAPQQQWGPINNLLDDENILKNEGKIGGGFVVKVTNDCKLGGSITSPPSLPSAPEINNEDLILNKDFGSLTVNRVLGQEYIEREYKSFPLSNMEKGDAIKYGSPVGINAIIIKFDQPANNFLTDILSVYSDADWSKNKASNNVVYDIYQKSNTLNRVGLWTSNNYLVLIHSSDGFHGDGEELVRQYLVKYPSTLT